MFVWFWWVGSSSCSFLFLCEWNNVKMESLDGFFFRQRWDQFIFPCFRFCSFFGGYVGVDPFLDLVLGCLGEFHRFGLIGIRLVGAGSRSRSTARFFFFCGVGTFDALVYFCNWSVGHTRVPCSRVANKIDRALGIRWKSCGGERRYNEQGNWISAFRRLFSLLLFAYLSQFFVLSHRYSDDVNSSCVILRCGLVFVVAKSLFFGKSCFESRLMCLCGRLCEVLHGNEIESWSGESAENDASFSAHSALLFWFRFHATCSVSLSL